MDNLEELLSRLPDEVAEALEKWRRASLDRERTEALLHMKYKAGEKKLTSDDVKALVRSDGERYAVVLEEIKAEVAYNLCYERLMSAKKRASLRVAF